MFLYVLFALQIFIRVSSTLRLNSKIGFDFESDINFSRGSEVIYDPVFGHSSSTINSFGNAVQFRDMIFVQKLDHFKPSNPSLWLQRYFVNDFYYEEGGPVFLFVYGESEASSRWMGRGPQWTGYAKKYNALCFGLEHRFYGKSRPTRNTNTTSLQYLTTQQALADVAFFIESMNRNNNFSSDTKWILFGGSYAGSLVAWARLKYPHLVHGAVASSAPLLAKTDFPEYFQVVERSLRRYSPKCVKNLAIANRHLKQAIRTPTGRTHVSQIFKLCDALQNNSDDISVLFETLADTVAFAVQYNGKTSFGIREVCESMNDEEIPQLQRYANLNTRFLNYTRQPCTFTNYTELVKYLKNDTYLLDSDQQSYRLWTYQTCTEYGFYQTQSKPNDLFGQYFPIDFFIKLCKDVFDPKFDRIFIDNAVQRTNREFGGLKFNASNVIFLHGDVDPWHSLGKIKKSNSDAFEVFMIQGGSHCSDMYSSSDDDSKNVKSARRKILETLKSWLVDKKEEHETKDHLKITHELINFRINDEDQNVTV